MEAATGSADPLWSSPTWVRAVGSRSARPRAAAPRRHQPRWSPQITVRAASQSLCSDGFRLDILDGLDASCCEGELYWDHRDGIVERQIEVIGRVEQVYVAPMGRDIADVSLMSRVRLDLTTKRGRREYERHQAGGRLAASIDFRVKAWPEYPSTWVRRWQLVNVSLVEPGTQADPRSVTPSWML